MENMEQNNQGLLKIGKREKREFYPLKEPITNIEKTNLSIELSVLIMDKLDLYDWAQKLNLKDDEDKVLINIQGLLRSNANKPYYIGFEDIEIPAENLTKDGIKYVLDEELEKLKFDDGFYSINELRVTCRAIDKNRKEIAGSNLDRDIFSGSDNTYKLN